jgi:hypothetical protein
VPDHQLGPRSIRRVGTWKARARRLVDELVDAGTWVRPALAGLLVAGAVSLAQAVQMAHIPPAAPGLAGAGATVVMRFYEFLRFRPARGRAIASVGRAAMDVLDHYLAWNTAGGLPSTVSTGELATLRTLAEAVRARRLRQELEQMSTYNLNHALRGLGSEFKQQAALGLPELASLRDGGRGLVDALEAAAATADELQQHAQRQAHAHPKTASLMRDQANAIVERLGEPIDRAARVAERLERRWDEEAGAEGERHRASERERIREERRCAHRATLKAARSLRDAVDLEVRSQDSWSVKGQRLTLARERFTGVSSVMAEQMDRVTLELSRDAFEHVADALIAAGFGVEAEVALKVPLEKRRDETDQAVKLAQASAKLTVALESIERDIIALEQIQDG